MTDEELNLIKELQPLFREKMGYIEFSDFIYCIRDGVLCGAYYCDIECDTGCPHKKGKLIVPDLYSRDPEKPERGLEGMIDGALICRRKFGLRDWVITVTTEQGGAHLSSGKTLYLALLKALKKQEDQKC